MHPSLFCRYRLVKTAISFLALLLFVAAQETSLRPVFAQNGGASSEAQQVETWNKSLRRAALQLAAASLSDGSGSGNIAPPLRLPQKIVILPLFVEKASGRNALPIAEPPAARPACRLPNRAALWRHRHFRAAFVPRHRPHRAFDAKRGGQKRQTGQNAGGRAQKRGRLRSVWVAHAVAGQSVPAESNARQRKSGRRGRRARCGKGRSLGYAAFYGRRPASPLHHPVTRLQER